jgi:hypothetical protein
MKNIEPTLVGVKGTHQGIFKILDFIKLMYLTNKVLLRYFKQ